MSLGKIYQKIVLLSPRIEVAIRCLYWNNVKHLMRFRQSSTEAVSKKENIKSDFGKILQFLAKNGIKQDDIIVLHSSYASVANSGLSAEEIIDNLLGLVGPEGTLAMPAIRHFPEEGEGDEYLLNYISDKCGEKETVYDMYKSTVSSGLLPFTLMRYDDAEISRFPLNPLVAVGAKASEMMKSNIDGLKPTAHGPNSAWAFCAKQNAWNVGIGVSIKDYLTMFHITQETNEWPVKDEDWYFDRNFIIREGRRLTPITITERKHKWTKYLAESNFYNDLHKASVIKSAIIDGVEVHVCRSQDLLNFIANQKNPTYPYLIPRKYYKSSE